MASIKLDRQPMPVFPKGIDRMQPIGCRQGQRHRARVGTPLVRDYMREFNDFRPLVCIIGDQPTKFGRRHRHRGYAQLHRRAFKLGSASTLLISLLSVSTASLEMPLGAPIPSDPLAS